MSIIGRMRKQNAVYWGPPVEDGRGGHTYPTPIAITCRWEDLQGTIDDPRTHDEMNNATVYVDEDDNILVNGYLYLGALVDVLLLDPEDVIGARKIKGITKTPNIRNTETLVMAQV